MTDQFDQDFPLPKQMNEAEALLREWVRWWWDEESAPPKLPDALHIRTSIYFTNRSRN